ncbi:MAG: radical SAM family heme chaperone HemW [Planctomycetota bacterium]
MELAPLSDLLPLARRRPRALYVHLPFCARRCPYCDFAVAPLDAALERRYLGALELELRRRLPQTFRPRTLYLGGGTPAELTTGGVARLVDLLGPLVGEAREVTLEANPRTLLPRKLQALVAGLGVSRLSLGAQSFSSALLETLGRFHRPADVARAVGLARDLGLRSVSLDLIFAVPGQSPADLDRDLDAALALAPDHVSVYGLTFEPGTPFEAARLAGTLRPQPEAREAWAYARLRRRLRAAGFAHYEVSSFARPGHQGLHNRVYWRNAPYVGLGNGAASHLRGVRSRNLRDVQAYAAALEAGRRPVAEAERLPPARKVRETAYLALRTSEGLVPGRFERDTGASLEAQLGPELRRLLTLGLLEQLADGRIRLSGRGVGLADAIARELL